MVLGLREWMDTVDGWSKLRLLKKGGKEWKRMEVRKVGGMHEGRVKGETIGK